MAVEPVNDTGEGDEARSGGLFRSIPTGTAKRRSAALPASQRA